VCSGEREAPPGKPGASHWRFCRGVQRQARAPSQQHCTAYSVLSSPDFGGLSAPNQLAGCAQTPKLRQAITQEPHRGSATSFAISATFCSPLRFSQPASRDWMEQKDAKDAKAVRGSTLTRTVFPRYVPLCFLVLRSSFIVRPSSLLFPPATSHSPAGRPRTALKSPPRIGRMVGGSFCYGGNDRAASDCPSSTFG
jgi:hypothetical protein